MIKAIQRLIWAYLFLYIHIKISDFDFLPSWVAYIFFYNAIQILKNEDSTIDLLTPLVLILGIYDLLVWSKANLLFQGLIGLSIPLFDSLASVLSLYFQFQLLTDIANIMKLYQCPQDKKLLTLRTIQTLVITFISLPLQFSKLMILSVIISLVQLAIMLGIIIVLYQFKFDLKEKINRKGG